VIQRREDRRKGDRRACTRCRTGQHPDPCYDCLKNEIVALKALHEDDRADWIKLAQMWKERADGTLLKECREVLRNSAEELMAEGIHHVGERREWIVNRVAEIEALLARLKGGE